MFEGTKTWFSFLYFVTAMLPAYLLFALQLNLGNSRLINYWLVLIIGSVGGRRGYFLKDKLMQRRQEGQEIADEKLNIKDKNGDVITFLFGVVIPSLLLPDGASWIEQCIVTIFIQLGCYVLVKNSSDVIPNVLLIFLGVNIYASVDGRYWITINKSLHTKKFKGNICRLGDSFANNVFILLSEDNKE